MGKIVITENVSLDGVIQDPIGDEGFSHGGWAGQLGDKDREQWTKFLFDEALATDALLLGRRSCEWFGARWTARSGAWADRLNSMPKYVISSTLAEAPWTNSTILTGDVVSEVSKLKQQTAGDIVVYASGKLAQTLLASELADELRLIVYPVVAGAGQRLFGETSDTKAMLLIETRTIGDSLALLTYQAVRDA